MTKRAESRQIPFITVKQMRKVDHLMEEVFRINLTRMMENAGRHLADFARQHFLKKGLFGVNVWVLAGTGGNGGGALVAARNLHNWGAHVHVLTTKPIDEYKGISAEQFHILIKLGLNIESVEITNEHVDADLIIDGLVGYSLKGPPRGNVALLINWANKQRAPILSLDVPSGIELDTGMVWNPALRAIATLTLALPKLNMKNSNIREKLGELHLADIGVPPELYAQFNPPIDVKGIFSRQSIVRVW